MENQRFFFSIVIPAHNEELYIDDTLKPISVLNYPKEKYEVFVIENGSTDKTFERAKQFERGNIKIISSKEKGVSKARNRGIAEIKKDGDWAVFLDADTILRENFLNELNNFLLKHQNENFVVGTASFRPFPDSLKARIWFTFYDLGHRLLKISNPPHIIRRSILDKINYDEQLDKAEDLKMTREARKYGNFFFFPTATIFSSTRRFVQVGWFKLFFIWMLESIFPAWRKKHPDYKVIR